MSPVYEYECEEGHKHEHFRPMSQSADNAICPECGQEAKRIISKTYWFMGFKFLKDKSEKSPPAPTDAGFYPEWDQAYAPYRGGDTVG